MLLSYTIIFFATELIFFKFKTKKKKRAVQEKQIIVFLVVAIPPSWKVPVRGKLSEVDYRFKGHLQDNTMQKISETMDNDSNGIHKNIIPEVASY